MFLERSEVHQLISHPKSKLFSRFQREAINISYTQSFQLCCLFSIREFDRMAIKKKQEDIVKRFSGIIYDNRGIIIPVVPVQPSFTPRVWEFRQYRVADRQDLLTYWEINSLSSIEPIRNKCRSISTRRSTIYHPQASDQFSFPSFLICPLLRAHIVSRVIASQSVQLDDTIFSKFISAYSERTCIPNR